MDSYQPGQRTPSPVLTAFLIAIAIFLITFFAPFWIPPSQENARKMSCMSNMKQIGLAMLQYAQDNDERLPPRQASRPDGSSVSWRVAIYPYIKSRQTFRCYSNPGRDWGNARSRESNQPKDSDFSRSYAVNSTSGGANSFGPFADKYSTGFPMSKSLRPGDTFMLVESTAAYSDFNVLEPRIFRWPSSEHSKTGSLFFGHKGRMNALFCDGHVKAISPGPLTDTNPALINPWTVDGALFSASNQAKATSVVEYGAKQSR